jgi:hypothetical protein
MSAATVLLVGGALPFALVTWWSLVTSLVAALALGLGVPVMTRAAHPGPLPSGTPPRPPVLQVGRNTTG